MSQRDPRAFLSDVVRASEGVLSRVADKTLADYKADETLRLACERLLSVAGEACAQLRRDHPDIAEQLGDIDRIVAFRNILIHGYFKLVDDIVWTIIADDLSELMTNATRILERPYKS